MRHPEVIVGVEYRTPSYLKNISRQYERQLTFIDTPDGIEMLIKQLQARKRFLRRVSASII